MTFNTKITLWALATLAWFLLCHYAYTCWMYPVCWGCADKAAVVSDRGPLVYDWDNATALTGKGWQELRSDIIGRGDADEKLVITGYYFADEQNTSSFENLGLARAAAARDLLAPDVPPERVALVSQLVEERDGVRENYFEAAEFNWRDDLPLASSFGNFEVREGASFPDERSRILADAGDAQRIEITGYYYEDETNDTEYPNLGIARATQIRRQYFSEFPEARIVLLSRALPPDANARQGEFLAGLVKVETMVEELDDRAIVYFPYNSTDRIKEPEIEEYLNRLADQLKSSRQKVLLTGHTDSDGSAEANQRLGRARARAIRSLLVRRGVSRSQIEIASEGETEPVASNDTDSGKQKNRRVVITMRD